MVRRPRKARCRGPCSEPRHGGSSVPTRARDSPNRRPEGGRIQQGIKGGVGELAGVERLEPSDRRRRTHERRERSEVALAPGYDVAGVRRYVARPTALRAPVRPWSSPPP